MESVSPPDARLKALAESKVFCMRPWLTLDISQDGRVFPCCNFALSPPLGSLRKSRLKDVWNSPETREVRRRMLEGREVPQCRRCYELDAAGAVSERRSFNREFASRLGLAEQTKADGSLEPLVPAILDLSISNRCNFKCRYCHPDRSTAWNEDHDRLWGRQARSGPDVQTPTESPEELLRQIEPILGGLERIYFDGGEPLICREHYQLLDLLTERKKTGIRLTYSTNFSVTAFEGRDVFELWKDFPHVHVSASLDAMGARGEYIRKNQDWARVVENRERMLRVCPHVHFVFAPTLSVMNALHLPELHRDWIEKGYLEPKEMYLNYVVEPAELSVQILPAHLKRAMTDRYERHIEWLNARCGRDAETAVAHFRGAINFVNAQDRTCLLERFRRTTRALDAIRGECFEKVFPELAELMAG